ncbi:MAG TPA: hypothetical protein VEK10_07490 [Steroidobacteraceae bacterium]|nr:hypothetical protein [Steroidobacteraceae bacterium]
MKRTATASLALLVSLSAMVSHAQDAAAPNCASNAAKPSFVVAVPGFPSQRLYIHPKHPILCNDGGDASCKAHAYVVTGDRLMMTTSSCAGWSYVEYQGGKRTSGWVASARLPDPQRSGTGQAEPAAAESIVASKFPACREAERLLNASLSGSAGTRHALPSALQNQVAVSELPKGVGADADFQRWGASVADVHVDERALKAVVYGSGGTCYDDYLELWSRDFQRRIPVAGSNRDTDEAGGYSSETLVTLNGRSYFAHFSRSARSVKLAGFRADLSTYPMCEVTELPVQHEIVKTAADVDLCNAVRTNQITGAAVDDIEPFELEAEALQLGEKGNELLGRRATMVGRGHFDIDNDGQPDEVGIVSYENGTDSAGCGHDVDTSVPLKLNADGMPMPNSAFNRKRLEEAGSGEDTRLFSFRGKTYLETRSRIDADGDPTHDVWELSDQGRKLMCEFVPLQYRAIDASQ